MAVAAVPFFAFVRSSGARRSPRSDRKLPLLFALEDRKKLKLARKTTKCWFAKFDSGLWWDFLGADV